MAIAPDKKDWTWVLQRPCGDCGFDAGHFEVANMPHFVNALADAWFRVLRRRSVRLRPSPDRWSPLEYACHVRDVFRLFDERLGAMITFDGAKFDNWDQDKTATDNRYDLQYPEVVAKEIVEISEQLAMRFSQVQGLMWMNKGLRSDGSEFTIQTFAQYLAHDPMHHLWDVGSDFIFTPR